MVKDKKMKERTRMKKLEFRRSVLPGLAMVGLLFIAPATLCAADAAHVQREAITQAVETLLGQSTGFGHEEPVYTDLGDGFYSLSMALPPKVQASLLEAMRSSEITGEAAQAQSLFVISVGQAPVLPPTPITATHGALSDTTFPYTYWIITLNLGSQTVTKSTKLKLTGPGLKFNRSVNVTYGANGIWGIGYSPGSGVRTPGVYTLQGTVSGGGSITTKSFAINP